MLGYYDRLIKVHKETPDRAVIADAHGEMTAAALLSGADEFSRRLGAMGVKRGEHVALCGFNSCRWLCAFFGIVKAGAVAVLLNYSAPLTELKERMEDMDCRVFLYGKCSAAKKDSAFAAVIQPDGALRLDIDSVELPMEKDFTPQELSEAELSAPAFIIFTSGSGGRPKGVLLSQRCNVAGGDAFLSVIPEMSGESMCLALPLFHIYGLSMTVAHLINGGFVSLPADFSPITLLDVMENYKTDAFAAVMTVITRLCTFSGADGYMGQNAVRRIYTGGAQLLPIHILRARTSFRNAVMLNGYGQTESDSCIAMTVPDDDADKRGYTVGRPLPHRTVRIVDSGGNELPTGAKGEVTVKDNGCISIGYYKLPPERQSIDANGWLHTGDIGFFDADGYLHLDGRIKDIIIKGGENVLPSKIELELSSLPGVREVKVMGAPSELYGENIEACLSFEDGTSYTDSELRTALTGKLPKFMLPEHFFRFDAFPLRPNGKTDALELKRLMLERLNLLRIEDELSDGIELLSIHAKSQKYIIAPICDAACSIITNTGFTKERAGRIRLCVEEMLTECANISYMEQGDIGMELRLYRDFMRVRFSCSNTRRPFSGEGSEGQSLSARLIFAFTDRVASDSSGDGVKYNFDYIFDKDFDVKSYIAS